MEFSEEHAERTIVNEIRELVGWFLEDLLKGDFRDEAREVS